jgi:hypothetical protein
MWQNLLSVHKNGPVPDKIISLENVQPNSVAYKRIAEQLQKYKLVENRHGSMLFTGKISVEDLVQPDKMQFMDSGLYITGVMAMLWEVPRSSIPFITKEASTKEDIGGNAERGYWRNIDFSQRIFAETMNTQLWIPHFGVKLVFENPYFQQDMQAHTARMQKLYNLVSENQLLARVGKQLTPEIMMKELERAEAEVEELDTEQMLLAQGMTSGGSQGTTDQLSQSATSDTTGKQNIRQRKRTEQELSISARGMAPSSRLGKEFKADWVGRNVQQLDIHNFVKLYTEDRSKNIKPPRILRSMMDDANNVLKFKSPRDDTIYATIITNAELVANPILMMNLGQILGKELDAKADIEYKEMVSLEVQHVDMKLFLKLYQEELGKNIVPPRLFMIPNKAGGYTFRFKSPTDFVYQTTVTEAELQQNRVWLLSLGYKIYKVNL